MTPPKPRRDEETNLLVPPASRARTTWELGTTLAFMLTVEVGLAALVAFFMWDAGAPTAALAVPVVLLAAYLWWVLPGRVRYIWRATRHAQRWATEPLYRARWENEE